MRNSVLTFDFGFLSCITIEIISALAVTISIATATPISAQIKKEPQYFFSNFYKYKQFDCKIFYPVPIGPVPSRKAADETCLPPPLTIIPGYGKEYSRLMKKGIRAGIRGDYNTALMSFRRAHEIEIAKNYLGYTNREALRGINGAMVAQRYVTEPSPVKRLTPKFFWYYWTGTGDRGNWGRHIIEHRRK